MSDITEGGKYYKPEISEFHVGLDCEIRYNLQEPFKRAAVKAYHTETFGSGSSISSIELMARSEELQYSLNVLSDKNEGFIRVKRLDAADLIELGWEFDPQVGVYEIKDFMLVFNGDGTIGIKQSYSFEKRGNKCFGTDSVFQGTIRNKSELAALMRMLGIEKATSAPDSP